MEKWNLIQNQHYFANFLQNHLLFLTKKENHGKEHAFGAKILKVNLRRPKLSMRVIKVEPQI